MSLLTAVQSTTSVSTTTTPENKFRVYTLSPKNHKVYRLDWYTYQDIISHHHFERICRSFCFSGCLCGIPSKRNEALCRFDEYQISEDNQGSDINQFFSGAAESTSNPPYRRIRKNDSLSRGHTENDAPDAASKLPERRIFSGR